VELSVRGLLRRCARGTGPSTSARARSGINRAAGSGFEDVPYFLFGAENAGAGTFERARVTFDLPQMSPDRAVGNGFALLPADRQPTGSVANLTVGDNVMLQVLPR